MDALPRSLLDAVAFAARAHRHQIRKDGQTPYHSHVCRVCLLARQVFGIDDVAVLTAAVLHDTIEDTTTDFDDLAERFGAEIAGWVATLTKNKKLPEEGREAAYRAELAAAPWQVKACKLADVLDNVLDSQHMRPEQRAKTMRRSRAYLTALDSNDLPPVVRQAWQIVDRTLRNEGGV